MQARVQQINAEIGKINTLRNQNIGQKTTLEAQLSELLNTYKTTYGVDLAGDEIEKNVEAELTKVTQEITESTDKLEKSIQLINSGNIFEAKKVLGIEEDTSIAPQVSGQAQPVETPTVATPAVEQPQPTVEPQVATPTVEPQVATPTVEPQVVTPTVEQPQPTVATPVIEQPTNVGVATPITPVNVQASGVITPSDDLAQALVAQSQQQVGSVVEEDDEDEVVTPTQQQNVAPPIAIPQVTPTPKKAVLPNVGISFGVTPTPVAPPQPQSQPINNTMGGFTAPVTPTVEGQGVQQEQPQANAGLDFNAILNGTSFQA